MNPMRARELWDHPAFQEVLAFLGVDTDKHTNKLSITLDFNQLVDVQQSFYPEGCDKEAPDAAL